MLVFGDVVGFLPYNLLLNGRTLREHTLSPQKKRTSFFLALDSRFYPKNPKHKCSTLFLFWRGHQFSIKHDFGMEVRLSLKQSPYNMDYILYVHIGLPGPERPFQPRISRLIK